MACRRALYFTAVEVGSQSQHEHRPERRAGGLGATLARVRSKLSELGLRYAAELALQRVIPGSLARFSRTILFGISTQEAGAPQPEPEHRWATIQDLELLTQFGHSREVLQARLRQGARPCVMERDGELVAYIWFMAASFEDPELRMRFRMPDRAIWLFDAMVATSRRGQGIYPALLRAASADLAADGIERIWIASDARNRNSVRALESVGARASRLIVAHRILRWLAAGDESGWRLRTIPAGSFWEIALDEPRTRL